MGEERGVRLPAPLTNEELLRELLAALEQLDRDLLRAGRLRSSWRFSRKGRVEGVRPLSAVKLFLEEGNKRRAGSHRTPLDVSVWREINAMHLSFNPLWASVTEFLRAGSDIPATWDRFETLLRQREERLRNLARFLRTQLQ